MTDETLRALERQFRSTQAVSDHAAWLSERVRVGEVSPEGLALAAFCGHDGATAASPEPVARPDASTFGAWVTALHAHCLATDGRGWAQLACLRAALHALEARGHPTSAEAIEGVQVVTRYLLWPRLTTLTKVSDFVVVNKAVPTQGASAQDLLLLAEACTKHTPGAQVTDALKGLSFASTDFARDAVQAKLAAWGLGDDPLRQT